jgi:lysophospholipase
LHGGADAMTAVAGSRLLYDKAGSADKTLKIYDDLFHEIFNEPEGREIVADVVAWMRQRDSWR